MFMPFLSRRPFVRSAPPPSTRLFLEALEARALLSTTYSLAVGTNVNIAQSGQGNAETTIAIDPMIPKTQTADTADSYLFAASNAPATPGSNHFVAYSTDGGGTWTLSKVTNIPTGGYDEQATFDQYGNLFMTYLWGSNVVVAWSADGGQTFAGSKVLGTGDQPSVATGHGSVWVSYNNGAGSIGSIAVSGASVSGPLYASGKVGTFSKPQTVKGSSGGGSYGDVKVGPNGEVMVTYQNPTGGQGPSEIYVNLNATGLGGTFGKAVPVTSTNVGGYTPTLAQPNNPVDAEANLAWDRDPSSPHFGRVYLVYTDRPSTSSNDTDIYVRYSDNDGKNWSSPIPVSNGLDDPSGDVSSQILPAIAVDQSTGFVAVTWNDTRQSTDNTTAQIWGTLSTDGGSTWLANVQIGGAGPSGPVYGADLSSGKLASNFNFGDYDTMDFANGVFYRSWADNANPAFSNPFMPAMTPATARVTVNAMTTLVTGGAGVSSPLSQTQGSQGTSAPATPGLATSKGSQSVTSAGGNSESIDYLFNAAGKAEQGAVWFRWTHGDLGGAGSDPTDGLATDEVF